ncbi:MAG: ABC-type phosphate/phosphonate transport system substrate-binding protein [Granulosicoccus sp.]|jgi:ABC-type phosphate/phosphonate transport system substrate-binding protein
MKRSLILTLALVFCLGMLSSCSKKCKGGGWYGNRNLGYVPQENKTDEAVDLASIYTTEEDCEETAD